ncbi:MAG: hypothetical protein AABW72_03165 [archaeon]
MRKPANKFSGRKPIKVRGEHASVVEITDRRHPLPGYVQRTKLRGTPSPRYNLALTLAHLFFPNNFSEIVAVSADLKVTHSRRIPVDKQSQKAIEQAYAGVAESNAIKS